MLSTIEKGRTRAGEAGTDEGQVGAWSKVYRSFVLAVCSRMLSSPCWQPIDLVGQALATMIHSTIPLSRLTSAIVKPVIV